MIAGTVLDRVPVRNPARAGDQFVLAADFHVHAFVGDGGVPPWELGREARRRGLDVIVVSNHNQLLAARLRRYGSADLRLEQSALIIPAAGSDGAAISHDRRRHHAGRSTGGCARRGHRGDPRAGRRGHRRASGPRGRGGPTTTTALRAARWRGSGAPGGAANRCRRAASCGSSSARSAAINPSMAPIGSSDFHFGGTLGQCRTFVFADEFSVAGVLDAVRRGATGGVRWLRHADRRSGPRRDRPPPAGRRSAAAAARPGRRASPRTPASLAS